jgi:hypothetical protein
VVCVVGAPAQCELGQVAGSHDDATGLVRVVEQYLGSLSGLGILEYHVGLVVVLEIREVLGHCGTDVNFPDGYRNGTAQFAGGSESVLRGTRAR